jgi:hypothetical protein
VKKLLLGLSLGSLFSACYDGSTSNLESAPAANRKYTVSNQNIAYQQTIILSDQLVLGGCNYFGRPDDEGPVSCSVILDFLPRGQIIGVKDTFIEIPDAASGGLTIDFYDNHIGFSFESDGHSNWEEKAIETLQDFLRNSDIEIVFSGPAVSEGEDYKILSSVPVLQQTVVLNDQLVLDGCNYFGRPDDEGPVSCSVILDFLPRGQIIGVKDTFIEIPDAASGGLTIDFYDNHIGFSFESDGHLNWEEKAMETLQDFLRNSDIEVVFSGPAVSEGEDYKILSSVPVLQQTVVLNDQLVLDGCNYFGRPDDEGPVSCGVILDFLPRGQIIGVKDTFIEIPDAASGGLTIDFYDNHIGFSFESDGHSNWEEKAMETLQGFLRNSNIEIDFIGPAI